MPHLRDNRSPFIAAALMSLVAIRVATMADEPLQPVPSYENFAAPLLDQYCSACHAGDAPEAGLALHKIEGGDQFQRNRDQWKSVVRRLRIGDMPPEGYELPTDGERQQLIEWIETRLAEFDCSGSQDPGWVTLRRLNRDQYKNTISDLLGVEFEPAKTFPPDELAYGFDNNADMLSLTTVLLEKYLDASRSISHVALRTPESIVDGWIDLPKHKWEGGNYDHVDARELSTEGTVECEHDFRRPGRYAIRVTASASQAGNERARLSILVANRVLQTYTLHTDDEEEIETFTTMFDFPAGRQRIGVAFVNDYYDEVTRQDRNLFVRRIEIVGPLEEVDSDAPVAHDRWFADGPALDEWRHYTRWRGRTRKILQRFATRAYRRPPPEEEIERLISLIDRQRLAGDTYERAMQAALQAMLVSPRFLFIGNVDQPSQAPEQGSRGYRIDEYELASRLSYFLWSSMPDERLFSLAGEGRLREQLPDEVDRMLRDRRSSRFSNNFAGQWLGVRQLAEFEPDESQFPGFDDDLRRAMTREAELVLAEVIREDLPITTLLDADFTYLNARLASHYGIDDVRGKFFRRVAVAEVPVFAGVRGGVLTMAGVLATTSNPNRTSPVKRGKWVLGELLGAEPPAPPPGIDSLDEVVRAHDRKLSIREQMALHRADPSCAVCHEQMDAIGMALENFDAVGRWRNEDEAGPIDASGELPSGEKIVGAADLRQVLLARGDAFRKCLAEKMLTYALGRGLEYYDECAVREIVDRVEAEDDRMQSLVMAIVESTPFQQRRYDAE